MTSAVQKFYQAYNILCCRPGKILSVFNVIAIYRHPNTNIANFIDKLDEALDSHNLLSATTYILGDIE